MSIAAEIDPIAAIPFRISHVSCVSLFHVVGMVEIGLNAVPENRGRMAEPVSSCPFRFGPLRIYPRLGRGQAVLNLYRAWRTASIRLR